MAELNNGLDNFKIYVGTYKKFNEGSLFGKWFKLSDFFNYQELLAVMKEFHYDEKEPKLMFLNWECSDLFEKFNIINKHYLSEDIYDIANAIDDAGLDIEILEAFSACFTENNIWGFIKIADDCYYGKFNNNKEFLKYLLGVQEEIPEDFSINFLTSNGHYFRKY